jgi:hypothetical protein
MGLPMRMDLRRRRKRFYLKRCLYGQQGDFPRPLELSCILKLRLVRA